MVVVRVAVVVRAGAAEVVRVLVVCVAGVLAVEVADAAGASDEPSDDEHPAVNRSAATAVAVAIFFTDSPSLWFSDLEC